jgi:hypothetical protein
MISRRIPQQLAAVEQHLANIEGMLLLKDPGAAKAAEAYEGLRRQIVAATAERIAHLAQLAQLDAAVRAGESTESLALLLTDLLAQAGLLRWDNPTLEGAFAIPPGHEGEELRVIEPAYIETHSGRVVRQGRAARVPDPAAAPALPTAMNGTGRRRP